MKKLQMFCLAVVLTVVSSRADTSYLLVQGPFGAGSAMETFKWQIDYAAGSAITGQDLLTAVFGLATNTGQTYMDGFGGVSPYYKSGDGTNGVGYASSSFGLFVISFTLHSTTVLQDPSYSPGWNYYVAGGTGDNNPSNPYANGAWTYSQDGTNTRQLTNGSFDGFVFGNTFPPVTISGANNAPVAANFTGATPVSAPEPTSLIFAAGALLARALRRRR